MRLNVVLTDEQNKAITERADTEGIPRAEVIRQAISSYLEPAPCRSGADEAEKIQELSRTLDTVTAEKNQAIEVLAQLTDENDRLKEQVNEVDRLRVELSSRDQMLAEKADEIRWLRAEVSKLNDRLLPAALTEQAGPGRRSWWQFWRG